MSAAPGRGHLATRPVAAFIAATIAVALFSLMDGAMKAMALTLGVYSTLLWRNLAGTLISGVFYAWRPRPRMTRAAFQVHAIRGAVSTVMALTFFWGLARIPMAQAIALTFIAPLLSLYLSAAILGERIARTTIVASSIAFVGVVVIVFGQWRGNAGPADLLGTIALLCSASLYAFNIVLMRKQALVAAPIEVAFSQSAIVTVLLAVGGPFFARLPAWSDWPLLLVSALLAVVSLLLMAWAYARSDANRLSSSEYTSFVWAAALGWILFGERVTAFTLAGAALIVVGCAIAARQRQAVPLAEIEALR